MSPTPPYRASPLPALWLRLLDREPLRRPVWLRWGFAVLVTGLALWLRLQIGSPESGARFATLTLAVVISGLYGGFSAGMLSTVLGMVAVNLFMIAPLGRAAINNTLEAFWLNTTFLVTQLVILGAIWVMQQRNQHLHDTTRELRESQKMAQTTFEHAAAGISHVGVKGQLLAINQTFCNLVGYTEDELRAMTFQDITVPEDLESDLQFLEQALAGERSQYALEKRYIHKNGHTIWAKLTVALMRKDDGTPDYFISVVQDISSLKAAEAALRNNKRLMEQAQNLAGFVCWEADIANDRYEALGRSHPWLVGEDTQLGMKKLLDITHPDDRARYLIAWKDALRGQAPFDIVHRTQNLDRERWLAVQAEFERDANGRATRALGVTQDVTDRKRAELEIQRLNASLEHRIQERTQALKGAYAELESYSYAVAHDLRSPLRIINGFAQALEDDNATLSADSLIHIQRIKNASQKMGLLIDALLQLSQYARGDLVRQDVNLSAIAQRLLEELAENEPQRQVEWVVEPNLRAQADPALIEAVLQNLLHNAWKYTALKELAHIRVFQEVQGNDLRFCVSDDGAGFDMNLAAKLFQPFQRLHMPNEFGGIGVGLATAQRIVKRHGGELCGTAAPGQGARFSFNLPAPTIG